MSGKFHLESQQEQNVIMSHHCIRVTIRILTASGMNAGTIAFVRKEDPEGTYSSFLFILFLNCLHSAFSLKIHLVLISASPIEQGISQHTIAVVTLQTSYLGKIDFLSVTDFSLGNLPRGNFIVWGLDMSREQQTFP